MDSLPRSSDTCLLPLHREVPQPPAHQANREEPIQRRHITRQSRRWVQVKLVPRTNHNRCPTSLKMAKQTIITRTAAWMREHAWKLPAREGPENMMSLVRIRIKSSTRWRCGITENSSLSGWTQRSQKWSIVSQRPPYRIKRCSSLTTASTLSSKRGRKQPKITITDVEATQALVCQASRGSNLTIKPMMKVGGMTWNLNWVVPVDSSEIFKI